MSYLAVNSAVDFNSTEIGIMVHIVIVVFRQFWPKIIKKLVSSWYFWIYQPNINYSNFTIYDILGV